MPDDPSRPWLRMLRRPARETDAGADPALAENGALWSAYERAIVRARDAGAAAQRIASTAARQRTAIESVADRTRALSSRAAELQTGTSKVLDAFERLTLVALNAGLEGARLGEAAGRPLALVSDEVRAQATRGGDAGRELGASLGHLAAELAQLNAQVDQAHAVLAAVTQDSARAAGAASDAEAALLDIGERIKKATGSDPETIRAVAEANERARGLAASLASIAGKVPRDLLLGALEPVFEPIAQLLADESDSEAPRP